jgi:hypothetical protein
MFLQLILLQFQVNKLKSYVIRQSVFMRSVGTLDWTLENQTSRWNVGISKLLFATDEVFRWKTIQYNA